MKVLNLPNEEILKRNTGHYVHTETSSNMSEALTDSDSDESDSEQENDSELSDDSVEETENSDNSIVSCSNSDISEYSSSIDDNVNCVIYNFPVQIICMEHMYETLDNYIENNKLKIDFLYLKEKVYC